ncbi:RluA family pseudouridine synthase [Geomobilimonas luticola]|uniref:Pseudouridine synthase n=1 Tax=Geomobilimonas luticola TaxID=1114878 RepID=A0ABS5SDB8_9BACT|nr:RluA family pseudouridine synthase [Geomobilimonas luticola]MBT0653377.1 RluA family pseudouridine synthase [Geomobilimonas luticola]
METHEFIYPPDSEPARLDQAVAQLIGGLTRAAAQRLIEAGMVTVGGTPQKPSLKLRGGERILVTIPPPVPATPAPEAIPLTILYEDRDLVVVNKPAGMVVHPGAGTSGGTLVNALLAHCVDLSGVGGELRPGIVHRIDKDTSGVIVVAKHDASHQSLAHQFKEHTIKRIYLALVFGSPKTDKGRIESVIGRHPTDRKKMSGKARHGKHAVTHWQVLGRYSGVTLLKLRLETGRTHQIRVHLSEAGHPLLGDDTYGGGGRLAGIRDLQLRTLIREMGRQALHAKTLGFLHPTSGEYLEFDTDLPEDMGRIIEYLENQGSDPKNGSEGTRD